MRQMRLSEIDRGDGLGNRLLIGFISMVSRMRLPDAGRVAFYYKNFFGVPMGNWTQAAMRGPSAWTISERELMAAMVAKWNACAFCVSAHGAIAAKGMQQSLIDAVMSEFQSAPISDQFKATLAFLKTLTLQPDAINTESARAVLRTGVDQAALTDAVAIAALFNIVTRYADALHFAMPTPDEFDRAASMLLKRGYAS
jgi:uncharacterized peroxidase-related enzyme